MTDRQKKMTAALAAVSAYGQQEEEAAAAHSIAALPPPSQAGALNLWGPSGRLEVMSMRRLIQMRAFDRIR